MERRIYLWGDSISKGIVLDRETGGYRVAKRRCTALLRADGLDLAPIRQSIATIMELAPDYEFRTTVVKPLHEEGDFPAIGELIRGAKQYFLQYFTDRAKPEDGLKDVFSLYSFGVEVFSIALSCDSSYSNRAFANEDESKW